MLADQVRLGFERRSPWHTKFMIEGQAYGGNYDAAGDVRVRHFFEQFPNPTTILELGSFEGGHSLTLAQHAGVGRVLGLEGRESSLDRARFVQEALGVRNVEFRQANLETEDLSRHGRFDAVFCVGVLYHLPEPWNLVRQIARVTDNLFLWTHYAEKDRAQTVVRGYKVMNYLEGGLGDILSGLSPTSLWLTLDSLVRLLKANGFRAIHLIENDPNHPNGACVTLAATTTRWGRLLRRLA